MSFTVFKLHFKTPLHIGSVRADLIDSEQLIHSDTLYAAIIHAMSVLGIQHPLFDSAEVLQNLGFTCTSLFPFYQENSTTAATYFFPKPLMKMEDSTDRNIKKQDSTLLKKSKKVAYLDEQFFVEFLKTGGIANLYSHINASANDEFLSQNAVPTDFLKSKVDPRVMVPRTMNAQDDTTIFYVDRLFFQNYGGLYFLAQFDNEEIKNKVTGALRYLQDEGLGTDRNVGNGLFELTEADTDLPTLRNWMNTSTDHSCNLSLVCPEDSTVFISNRIAYQLMRRGGWITSMPHLNYRKNSVYMVQEGSILKNAATTYGKTVNLRPKNTPQKVEHPIYRVGKSLFVPVKLQADA